jgi:site-specific DNA recombinase
MSCVIYARKSTESEDRQVLSIDSQIKELQHVAERLGYPSPKILRESMSAKAPGRPIFGQLMADAEMGKVKVILCWKLDRLARNPVDGGRIIWGIKNNSLSIVTPSQSYSREEENTILMYVEFGMAQKYIDDLGKNVRRGIRAKLETGWLPGSAPFGYMNKLDDHTIVPDGERFELIKKLWHLILDGYTPEAARKVINEECGFLSRKTKRTGGKPLGKSSLYRIIRSPFYYGVMERKVDGEVQRYPGFHEPMITEEQFWRVQEILGLPRPKPEKLTFTLSGVIRCGECGASVTPEEHTKKSGKYYVYYHCTKRGRKDSCSQKSITGKELDQKVGDVLAGIVLPERFTSWAVEWLKETNRQERSDRTTWQKSIRGAYDEIQTKLDKLTDTLLDNLLTPEEFRRQKERLTQEQKRLKEKLGDVEQRAENWLERVESTFRFAKTAKPRFEAGTSEERRCIAIALGSQFILRDQALRIELFDMWQKFSEIAVQLQGDCRILELAENGQDKEKTTAQRAVILSWQGRRGSNPE